MDQGSDKRNTQKSPVGNAADDLSLTPEDETIVSKCPSCGGNMVYNPSTYCLQCESCGRIVEIRHRMASEIGFDKLVDAQSVWDTETRAYVCNSCGAKQLMSRRNMSPICAFCGTANVIALDSISGLRPNAILPFTINEADAHSRYAAWASKKFFAPRKFKKELRAEKISGHYLPAFTFDSDTYTPYDGMLGEYYYTTYTDSEGHVHTQQHTRWFSIHGAYRMFHNDIFVDASAPDARGATTLRRLSPYNTDDSNEYSDSYLYGFSASQNERSGLDCWAEARDIMEKCVRRGILSQYSYDVIGRLNFNMQCYGTTYKYLLLPVYIGHATYRDRLYNFYMNGQNGKISGKTPRSVGKILSLVGGGLALIGGFIALLVLL